LLAPTQSVLAVRVNRASKSLTVSDGRARRLAGVGIAMLGLPVILWLGAAVFVANQLKFPIFLSSSRGDDVIGPNAPERTGHPYDLARAALGVMPDEFKAGTVAATRALGGFPIEVTGLIFHGRRRETILLLPAAGGGAESLIPYVKFLYEAGYSVVALDSVSNPRWGTDFGWTERLVALKAADELRKDGVDRIAIFGISEGGAAAIFAAAARSLFSAVIADSSYANLNDLVRRNPSIAGLHPAFESTVIWIAEHRWFGQPLDRISPAQAARGVRCSLLIIQNVGDPFTPVADGQAIAFAAGAQARLWIAASKGHGDAIFEVPAEYQHHVLDFLAGAM
jgi:pimeloyl-ACP methyl ester carboxylesterase